MSPASNERPLFHTRIAARIVTVILALTVATTSSLVANEKRLSRKALREWEEGLKDRTYYVRRPVGGFIANERIRLHQCDISREPTHLIRTAQGGHILRSFEAVCEFSNRLGTVGTEISFDRFDTPGTLDDQLASYFSTVPLEQLYDWPETFRQAVGKRDLLVGMTFDMVDVALGRIPHRTDKEVLPDGRLKTTWKYVIEGDTRYSIVSFKAAGWASHFGATDHVGSTSLGLDGTRANHSGTTHHIGTTSFGVSGSGVAKKGGLPPVELRVEFLEGTLSAFRTRYIE